MPALRGATGVTRGTRTPEGAAAARPHGTGIYREVPLWPGITWGYDARCLCSWAVRYGVMQVKVESAACTVHIGAEPPLPVLLGQVAALLAEALESADGRGSARCGTPSGYNRHRREGTKACPACLESKRLVKHKPGTAGQEAA